MPLVYTAGPAEIVTRDELKAHANITATTHDVELDLMRLAAQEAVEHLIGPVIHRAVTEVGLGVHGGVAVLRESPVVSVDSITIGGTAVTGYRLHPDGGLIEGLSYSGSVDVSYTVGRSVVPASVKMATLIIARHLWDTQRGNAPTALPSYDDQAAPAMGLGYAIPNRAMDLLAPHLRPPAVA